MEKKDNLISILGSANIDFFLKVKRLPQIGETISSEGLSVALGGKVGNLLNFRDSILQQQLVD